ncbi:MAG: TIGR01212 family radical SAM protein [Deltaproteobacteria bacterium]|nr:TIGR01212 family radical SAM protein [Deltaproteobacteria bacterium]MBW2678830.1 TIGR01212 family radical SAM protein [Deltaproteobacteria bacterium]
MNTLARRYTDLNSYYRSTFGCRVQKIAVDAGLTCPNRDGTIASDGCIYCNALGSGTGALARGLSISEQISRGKIHLARRYKAKKFMVYFQSFSNTYAPLPDLKKIYDEALKFPEVVGMSIGTRPDCVDDPVLDLLKSYTPEKLVWVEYGLQSAHDATLALINRGHDVQCFAEAVCNTRKRGLKTCAHVIIGLPGEGRSHVIKTAEFLTGLGIDGVKLHLLYVIRGTGLANLHKNGTYQCLEQDAYVDLVCDFLERIPDRVIIQRLTGDPHAHELVAPQWSLDRNETFARINRELEKRGSRQGCRTRTDRV